MSELTDLLDKFGRGADLVRDAASGLIDGEADFSPAPGQWSVRQILAHLADSEAVGLMRLRQMAAEDHPTLIAYDQEKWADRLDYAMRDPAVSLELFRQLRASNHLLLSSLSPDAFERTGNHSERGSTTLRDWARIYGEHAEKHAGQIQRVRAAFQRTRTTAAG